MTLEIENKSDYFDLNLAKKSNIAIFGFSGCGKTRLACDIASQLQRAGYWVAVFDPVGIWKNISNIPHYQQMMGNPLIMRLALPCQSVIYDISGMVLEHQQSFINEWCRQYFHFRRTSSWDQPAIIIFEESHLFARNLRSKTSQQILRLATAGRNFNTRVLSLTQRVSNLSTEISEQSEQIYLGYTIGENNRRKIRTLLGKEWIKVAEELEVGEFIWRHGRRIEVVKVPLFNTNNMPEEIKLEPIKKRSLIERILGIPNI